MGQVARLRAFPSAAFRDVTAPNADTLYTTTWIDVSKEPWTLSIPDMQDRYYLFPILDGWTNVFQVPGKRTTGTAAQTYAITGPGWTGTLPAGVTRYESPTAIVWILGGSTARVRRRTTPPCMRCRTRCPSCRSAPTASPTRRYTPARSTRRST